MEKKQNHVAERILNLTLEIIQLLTGEECIIVKKPSDNQMIHVSQHQSISKNTMTEPLTPSLLSGINDKIFEVTKKIIEPLTEEVPIRCEDVTVHFSMEEWEYLEEHKDLYKDIIIKDQPPLTSLDECRTIPERYPRYSQHSAQEHQIPQEDQDDGLTVCATEDKETPIMNNLCPQENTSSRDGQYTRNDMVEHVSSSHGDNLPDQSPPVIHYANHEEITIAYEKLFSCPECDIGFNSKSNLTAHLQLHFKKTTYPCLHCSKRFNTKIQALQHQSVHTGEKPYSCSECGKCFARDSTLQLHMRIHTGEKPYSCLECGRCFSQRFNLKRHKRTHSGQRPYPCTECGKCFSTSTGLGNHMRIHTGHKPYSCSICGKSFTTNSTLISHKRTHTEEKPFSF